MNDLIHYVEQVSGVERHVIELPRELDEEVLDEFDLLTKGLLSRPGLLIRVDCREVAHLTDTTFAVLASAHARAKKTGSRLWVDVRANPRLRDMFKRTGLSSDEDENGSSGVRSPLAPPPAPKPGQRAEPRPPEDVEPST